MSPASNTRSVFVLDVAEGEALARERCPHLGEQAQGNRGSPSGWRAVPPSQRFARSLRWRTEPGLSLYRP
jgi:hypothetical protein